MCDYRPRVVVAYDKYWHCAGARVVLYLKVPNTSREGRTERVCLLRGVHVSFTHIYMESMFPQQSQLET